MADSAHDRLCIAERLSMESSEAASTQEKGCTMLTLHNDAGIGDGVGSEFGGSGLRGGSGGPGANGGDDTPRGAV